MSADAVGFALLILGVALLVGKYIRVKAGGFPIESLDALGVPSFVPRSDDLAETAQWVHATARFVLIAFILLHIGAALKHGLIDRDGVVRRMWRPGAGLR